MWKRHLFSNFKISCTGHHLKIDIIAVLLLLLFYSLEFFTLVLPDRLSHEFEWQQVSSSLQDSSQYSVLNNAVVWMLSTRTPTSKSSSTFDNLLVSVPKTPITIGIIVTCMFHSFFQFPGKVEVFILLFTFFQSYCVSSRYNKVDKFANSLFCFFCFFFYYY